jgi:hypothetical protein
MFAAAQAWLKQRKMVKAEQALDPELARKPSVFLAPPFTPELVAAIRLISTQLTLDPNEESRLLWQKEQNAACWGEYETLAPALQSREKPKRVLEIGPGMGRSAVFFTKQFGWQESEFHLFDGNGTSTKYKYKRGPRFEDSFCGNLKLLSTLLDYNGLTNYKIIDAQETALANVDGPYDLIYSFYAIGFHWSLEHFIDDISRLMNDKSVGAFIVHGDFQSFPGLKSFNCRILPLKAAKKRTTLKLGMLLMSKAALPEMGRSL